MTLSWGIKEQHERKRGLGVQPPADCGVLSESEPSLGLYNAVLRWGWTLIPVDPTCLSPARDLSDQGLSFICCAFTSPHALLQGPCQTPLKASASCLGMGVASAGPRGWSPRLPSVFAFGGQSMER